MHFKHMQDYSSGNVSKLHLGNDLERTITQNFAKLF